MRRRKWSKKPIINGKIFSSFADGASKLLLPLVIAGLGAAFSYFQHKADVEQRNADRVTSFIKHLASDNIKEKQVALQVMNVLIDKQQLPKELELVFFISAVDSDTTISQLSQAAITKLTRTDSPLEESFVQEFERNPELAKKVEARIFIQLSKKSSKSQQILVKRVAMDLEKNGYSFPDVEMIDREKAPSGNELRYYREMRILRRLKLSRS